MYGQGPNMNFLVNQCRSTNAYPINPNIQTEYILKLIYDEIIRRYPNPEVNTKNYNDQTSVLYRVIYIRLQTLVQYRGTNYSVFSQVLFPPNFPAVPPIFSIINTDDNRFQVNKNYFNYLLPDGTYEVKLQSAASWSPNIMSFATMVKEFVQILSEHFPFFATNNPLKNPNLPMVYDPRYNDVNAIRPFDLPGSSGPGSNFGTFPGQQPYYMGGGYSQPSGPQPGMYNTPQPFIPSGPYNPAPYNAAASNPYSQTIPNTGGYTQNNSYNQPQGVRPTPTSQAFKDALYKMKGELDIDSKILFEHADYLIKKKDELTEMEASVKTSKDALLDQIKKTKQQEEELKITVEKSKTAKKDKIENYLEFGDPKDEAKLKIMADLRGSLETEMFIENAFVEFPGADLDAMLMKLNALWRKQFDKSLALKFI